MTVPPTICPQLAVEGRTELDCAGRQRGGRQSTSALLRATALLVLAEDVVAEDVGFEPAMGVTTHSDFQAGQGCAYVKQHEGSERLTMDQQTTGPVPL